MGNVGGQDVVVLVGSGTILQEAQLRPLLMVVSLFDPQNPVGLGYVPLEDAWINDVILKDDLALLGGGKSVTLVSLADKSRPKILGTAPGVGGRLATNGGRPDPLPEAADVLRRYERFLGGTAHSPEAEVESGYAAAERLLAEWAPTAQARRPGTRAAVAEILGRALEPKAAPAALRRSPASSSARKLGVFLLTARLLEHPRRGAAPGVRPIIVIEEPEAGLHPITLASVWSLLFEGRGFAGLAHGGASPHRSSLDHPRE